MCYPDTEHNRPYKIPLFKPGTYCAAIENPTSVPHYSYSVSSMSFTTKKYCQKCTYRLGKSTLKLNLRNVSAGYFMLKRLVLVHVQFCRGKESGWYLKPNSHSHESKSTSKSSGRHVFIFIKNNYAFTYLLTLSHFQTLWKRCRAIVETRSGVTSILEVGRGFKERWTILK